MKLCFEDVSIRSNHQVFVEHLKFELERGQISAIVGPSRSGKSTLLLVAAGEIQPNEGRVCIRVENGIDRAYKNDIEPSTKNTHLQDQPRTAEAEVFVPDRRLVGLGPISDFSPLFDTLTVREHLAFGLRLYQQPDRKRRLEELLETFHLRDVARERIKDIDQFGQFRVALAHTVLHQPSFVLLDEPERGLSVEEWVLAQEYLRQLATSHIGILYTTVLESTADWTHSIIHLPTGEVRTN
jgi:ABC-type multidrug transport system ATPase subunit